LNLFIRISFLFFSLSLFPQLVSLDEVTVSESKISLPFSQKYRSIEIISSEAIIESGARNIIDILQQVSGVDIRRRGSAGTQADLYIRGGGFDQTLLLIDGMKMDDIQTGHHTLNLLLPIHLVERIEIIKGPAARIFGQNAFNGAINIVTKKIIEDDDNQFEVFLGDVSYGSYEKFNFSINSKLTIKDNYSSLFTYSRNKSNGYRYNTDFSNEFLFFKSEIKTSKNPINILSGFTEKKFGANGFYASPSAVDQYEETQSSFFGITSILQRDNLLFKPKIYWRRSQDEYIYVRNNPSIYRNLHISNKIYFDFDFINFFESSNLNFGLNFSKSFISSNNLGKHERFTSTFYSDYTFRSKNKKFKFSPGFSISHFSDLSFHFFPGFDIGFDLNENLNLYANYGKTYRIPTYTDLYYTDRNTIGNPALDPEHAISNEIGVKFISDKIEISSSYFYRKSSNIIDYVKENDDEKWQATNIRNLNTNGFDFDLTLVFLKKNSINIAYNYLFDKSFVEEINFSRYSLNSLRHQLNTRLILKYSKKVSQSFIYKFGQRSNNTSHRVFDTNISYEISDGNYFFINVNNLFNESYYETNLVPMPGRNFLFGLMFYLD
jgi:iron complex outermembrane receptor protein